MQLIGTNQLPEKFINHNLDSKTIGQWKSFGKAVLQTQLHKGRIDFGYIDRSNTIPNLMPVEIDFNSCLPLIDAAYNSRSYLDVCLERAQNLLDTGLHINILWSGGLDSSLALFSLLHQAHDISQLSIICDFNSVVEGGKMFDQHILTRGIRIKFDTTRMNSRFNYRYDHEDSTQLYVNGQCGDQMFGPRVSISTTGSTKDHWSAAFDKKILDILEPTLKYSARPIENVRDIRWWYFFNFTWTTVYYEDAVDKTPQLAQRIVPFYGTMPFQTWSANTDTWHTHSQGYRTPAREALSQLIDYQYYIDNKEKVWSSGWSHDSNWYAIDKDFKTYYTTDK